MNARLVSRAADLICRSMKTKQTAAGIAADLDAAGMLQSPESAAEVERLRTRVAELEQQTAAVQAVHVKHPDSEHCQHDGERWPCPTLGAIEDDETPCSPWQRVVDALNALEDMWIPVHIEPDGHISNPLGDEHIEWARDGQRWRLVHDDEADEVPLTAEQIEARRLDYRATMRAAGGDLP
ncbi:hypothetical protein QOM21_24055 [Streptomyces sp. Pv4-95]|uniref:hypothetical protein n=1 Tax=Streptomyces sp. Pv4-95 TaxID=3049543 RepID=UPI0038919422